MFADAFNLALAGEEGAVDRRRQFRGFDQCALQMRVALL